MSRYRSGLIVLIVASFFAVGESAQAAPKAQPLWQTICQDDKNPKTCRIVQKLYLSKIIDGKQKNMGQVLALTVLYLEDAKTKNRLPYMSIQMPLGVDLRPGAVMRIDEAPETRLTYLQCTNVGCDASLPLDAKTVKALKAGNAINVGFRPWGQVEVTAISASLKGFREAFKGIK